MAKPSKTIATRFIRDLGKELQGLHEPFAFGVGSDGELLVAGLDQPHDWVVWRIKASGPIHRTEVRGERLSFTYVQPFAGGLLLAAARCHWRPEGAEQNAVLVDEDGQVRRRLTLGDGIADLRTTADDSIWASYFDEGVFGNYGWNSPGPRPIGAAGLVRFDGSGEPRGAYDAAAAGTDDICDAYALNVEPDGTVWVYFYTEFPIVRWRAGQYTRWACGLGGARAIAVRDDRALLVGNYDKPALARTVQLRSDGTTALLTRATIVTPEGAPIGPTRTATLGHRIFFLEGSRVLEIAEW
jgi:hypothetical protein